MGMHSFHWDIKKLQGEMGSGCGEKGIVCGSGKWGICFFPGLQKWLSGWKLFLYKHEALSWDPQHPHKKPEVACMPASQAWERKKRQEGYLGLLASSIAKNCELQIRWETLSQDGWRVTVQDTNVFLSSLCTYVAMCTCVCMGTHANTIAKKVLFFSMLESPSSFWD